MKNSHFSPTRLIDSMVNKRKGTADYERFHIEEQKKKYPEMKRSTASDFILTREIEKEIVDNLDFVGVRDLTALTTTAGLSKLLDKRTLLELAEFLSNPPVFEKVGIKIIEVGTQPGVIPREDTEVQADIVADGSEGTPVEPTYDEGYDIEPIIYKAGLKVSKRFYEHFNMKESSIPIVDVLFIQRIKNAIFRKLDRMIFYGSGVAPEPYGLKNNVNINSISGADFDRDKAIDLENLCELYNVNDPRFYILHPNTKKLLKKRPVGASNNFLIENNSMNDYQIISSNQMDEGDVFHGGFSTVLIEQFGPGIEIFINPYKDDFAVSIIATGFYGFTVRTPKTISLASSVT